MTRTVGALSVAVLVTLAAGGAPGLAQAARPSTHAAAAHELLPPDAPLATSAGPATLHLDSPERLADELSDRAQLLGDTRELRELQDRLVRERGLQLFVVTVHDFDGLAPQAWLARTAELSQLGEQDLLLSVSSTTAFLRAPAGAGLEGNALHRLEVETQSRLTAEGVDAAVLTMARGLLEVPTEAQRTRTILLLAAAVVAVLSLLAALTWGSLGAARRRREAQADLRVAAQLARDHGALTVSLDEAIEAADLETQFAEAEFDPTLVASMRETVADARAQATEIHRRRAEVVGGPVAEPHWRVEPAQARAGMADVVDRTEGALRRVGGIPGQLAELRRQSDLVPGRVAGLRELAMGRDDVDQEVWPLLDRAEADVRAGRPEHALIPLQTVVALLQDGDRSARDRTEETP